MWALSIEDIKTVTKLSPPFDGDVPLDESTILEVIEDPSELRGWTLRKSDSTLWVPWETFNRHILPKIPCGNPIPRFSSKAGVVEFR